MSEERKIVIPVAVDGSGAAKGFDQVKQSAAGMAQAVGKSATDAGKAIDGIGTSSEKLNATQSRVLESIKRTTIGTTEGKAALLEYKAGLAGVTDAASPYIAKLKLAEQGQVQLGMSAKATSAALRGVPAQFTDIITSLQGGQKPLSVLLQQGGQLKDMFGGVGNAARALGGYFVGLINPFTLAAGAALGLFLAYQKGANESNAYATALITSGNAAGATTSQLQGMAKSISSIAGSQAAAAAGLAEFAAAGTVGRDKLEAFTAAALKFEKATGQAVSKTVEQFSELAKSPLDAAVKLNEKYNFLTLSVYQQIKALEDQGRATEAANVAQKAFADTIDGRAGAILQNLGLIERAWNGIKGAISGTVSAAAGIGRATSTGDRLAQVSAEIAKGRLPFDASSFGGNAEARAKLTANLELERSLRRQLEIEEGNAAAAGASAAQVKARIAFDKDGEQYLTKRERMEKEITKTRQEGLVAGASEIEIQKRIAGIRDKFKESGSGAAGVGQNEVAAINAKVKAAQQELARLQAGGADQKMTEGEKLVIKIKEELTTSIKGQARAEKERALVAAEALAVVDKQVATETAYQKALKESEAALTRQVDAVQKQADSIRDQAIGQEAVNANLGKSKTAIEQAALAQLKLNLAEAEASDRFAPAYVAALTAKTAAQERYVQSLQQAEFLQSRQKLDETARGLAEETQTLELQLSLMGRSQAEREKIIGLRRVEVKLAKELADIDKLNLGQGAEADAKRAELRAKAAANAVIEGNNVASKAVLDEWQRTADSINQSLTDALLRGFESGKGFAQNLRDTLVNMFKTLVLRPVISAALSPISGAISQAVSGIGGAAGVGNGIGALGGLLGAGSSLGMFGQAAGATLTNGLIGGFGANMANIATLAQGGQILGAIGAAAPYIGVALAAIGLFAGKGGGPKTEAGFADGLNIAGLDIGGNRQGSERGDVAAAQKISDGISGSYEALAKQLGLVNQKLDVGVFYAMDNAKGGTSQTQLQITSSAGYNRSDRAGGIENVARGEDALKAALAEETIRVLVDGLKASDLGQQYKDILNALTKDAGADVMQAAINRISAAKQQQTQLEAAIFNLTATDTEKLTKAREDERKAIDPLNAALLEQLYTQQDLAKATEAATEATRARAESQQAYDANFLTAEEQRRKTAQSIADSLSTALGGNIGVDQVLSTTRDQFRAFVDSLDETSEHGLKVKDAMLSVASAFASITQKAEIAATTVQQIEFANAGDLALAEAQRNYQIFRAAQEVRDSWKATADAISDYMKELRGELFGSSAATFSNAQSQFAIATAQARAGDQAAANSLPALAKLVQEMAIGQSSTQLDYARVVAATLASLDFTLSTIRPRAGLPSFDVGTPLIQRTGIALVHEQEAILPARAAQQWRETGGNSELVAEIKAMREEMAEIRKNTNKTERNTDQANKQLQSWSKEGVPVINQPETTLA